MRTAVMRRMASLVLAMVWAVARLAQPLQPACPHHATDKVVGAVAHQHHVAHHAEVGGHGAAEPASAPEPSAPAFECAAHCCAAAAVSMPQSAWSATIVVSAAAESSSFGAPTNPVVRPWTHWQPPSTAPPSAFLA